MGLSKYGVRGMGLSNHGGETEWGWCNQGGGGERGWG